MFEECTSCCNGLDKTHQRDAERTGPQPVCQGNVRDLECRETGRDIPDDGNSPAFQPQQCRCSDTSYDGQKRCGRLGPDIFHDEDQRQHDERDDQRGHGKFRDVTDNGYDIVKEPTLVEVLSQQFWDLVHHDHHTDTCLESCQHRI